MISLSGISSGIWKVFWKFFAYSGISLKHKGFRFLFCLSERVTFGLSRKFSRMFSRRNRGWVGDYGCWLTKSTSTITIKTPLEGSGKQRKRCIRDKLQKTCIVQRRPKKPADNWRWLTSAVCTREVTEWLASLSTQDFLTANKHY